MVDDKTSVLERHAQTILTTVVAGLIAWVGINVSQQGTQIALLQQSVDNLKGQVHAFAEKPRFTKDDFLLEMRLYENRMKLIEGELTKRSLYMEKTGSRLMQLERHMQMIKDDFYIEYADPRKKKDK